MVIDVAGERSEQGRFLSKSPGSSNAVLDDAARTALLVNLSNSEESILPGEIPL